MHNRLGFTDYILPPIIRNNSFTRQPRYHEHHHRLHCLSYGKSFQHILFPTHELLSRQNRSNNAHVKVTRFLIFLTLESLPIQFRANSVSLRQFLAFLLRNPLLSVENRTRSRLSNTSNKLSESNRTEFQWWICIVAYVKQSPEVFNMIQMLLPHHVRAHPEKSEWYTPQTKTNWMVMFARTWSSATAGYNWCTSGSRKILLQPYWVL